MPSSKRQLRPSSVQVNAASTQFHGNATRNPRERHWFSVYPTRITSGTSVPICFPQHQYKTPEWPNN